MTEKMVVAIKVVFVAVCMWTTMPAQETNKKGTAAAVFLRIPVGARGLGMGDAYVSMKDDPSAMFWNPSVLATVQANALIVDHARWLPGIDFDYVGIVLPLQAAGTVGISTTILHTDEMDVTTPDQQMGTGEKFTASSIAVGVTYSRSLTDRFSIGGSFKYIHESLWDSYASGIAFDIGTIFVTPFAGIRLGASIANFGTKMKMDGDNLNVRVDIAPDMEGNNQSVTGKLNTDAYDLPLIMRIGISGEVFQTKDYRLTLAVDAVNPNDNAQSANLGAELGLLGEKIVLRTGYRDLFLADNEFHQSFGVSLNNIEIVEGVTVSLHYAYQQYAHLGESNRFTVDLRF
ncbi:MAG TPA: PorV/PorQ family protein [Bacteroidota bacterium]|nr:PorV/PorQ family protein [Bacteroidota bacterium]